MATWGAMKTRIANEIARSDLTSEITDAMKSAVRHYRYTERFWLSGEYVATFYTVADQEWYTDAQTSYNLMYLAGDDSITITSGGVPQPLRKATYEEMEAWSVGTQTTGIPTHYCFYANQLRLYPTPDAVYTLTMSGNRAYISAGFRTFPYDGVPPTTTYDDTAPQDSAEGFWTTEGEELIRLTAKIDLFMNVIRDPSEAATLVGRRDQVLADLRGVANRRNGAGYVVAEYL